MKNLIKSLFILFVVILIGNSSFALTIEEQPKGDASCNMKVETSANSEINYLPAFQQNDVKLTLKEKILLNKFVKNEYFKQGQPEQQEEKQGNPKSQIVALLLAIFLGGLGIHRFYLGYPGIGIIQLLTAGGCGIWALVDIIMIATGSLKPADGSDYDPKF